MGNINFLLAKSTMAILAIQVLAGCHKAPDVTGDWVLDGFTFYGLDINRPENMVRLNLMPNATFKLFGASGSWMLDKSTLTLKPSASNELLDVVFADSTQISGTITEYRLELDPSSKTLSQTTSKGRLVHLTKQATE